ncbi:MAG: amidohydrolase [Pyrinomonadaceae bacterium]
MRIQTRFFISLAALSLVLLPALFLFSAAAQKQQPNARRRISLLLVNGKIFTADAQGTIAQAVAIDNERIVAIGTNEEIKARYSGERTIDLAGKLVTPGFNDAHIHFLGGGLALLQVDLNGARSLDEAVQRVAAKVREVSAGAWITGRGWDHTLWSGKSFPTRQDLDTAAPRNPAYFYRVDGHVVWANSAALAAARITRETPNPTGGEIERDAQGEPTGILKETAAALLTKVVPEPTHDEKIAAIERSLAEARRYGITSVTDIYRITPDDTRGYETTKLYRELLRRNRLTARVSVWQNFDNPLAELIRQREEFKTFNDDPRRLRLGALKGYIDGSLGSRTAALIAPYTDDAHNSGIPRHTPEELTKMIVERDAAGFQIALHAIGDSANRIALDGFEAAARNPHDEVVALQANVSFSKKEATELKRNAEQESAQRRHRIEHAQVVAPADFARFRDLKVVASMQPSHAISDKRWAQDRLGEYRVLGAYAWHTMRAFGVHTPFGTDWPVEPINPYLGLYAAVTRRSPDGNPPNGWWPQERLTIADAIRAYTTESAYASFEETEKGQLLPGMLADLCVHSRDLLTIKPEDILRTEAVMTILGGKVIYERTL